MRSIRRLLVAAACLLAVAAFAAACSNDDDDANLDDGDDGVGATPGPQPAESGSPLFDARRDLAARLNLDTRDVTLLRIQHAGFDGCLGLTVEDQPCTQQFIGGHIAFFAAGGSEYRYHFGGSEFLAVDFLEGEAEDGMEVPPELRVDVHRLMAAYALHDAALREGGDAADYAVTAIVPVDFPNACIGFERPDTACAEVITPGAIVLIATPGGDTLTYHVDNEGQFIATDFEEGQVTVEPDADVVAVQQAMREDLASRTGADVSDVGVVAYRDVTWRSGCLGVTHPGDVCTAALVDGFLAFLTDGSGEEFRYHGAGDHFIAASFEEGAEISEPIVDEEE